MIPEQRHPPMQVRTRGPSRHPDATDRPSSLHPLALFDGNCTHMNVNASQAMAVVQHYRLTGEKHVLANQDDTPWRRGSNGCARWRRYLNAILLSARRAVEHALGAKAPG